MYIFKSSNSAWFWNFGHYNLSGSFICQPNYFIYQSIRFFSIYICCIQSWPGGAYLHHETGFSIGSWNGLSQCGLVVNQILTNSLSEIWVKIRQFPINNSIVRWVGADGTRIERNAVHTLYDYYLPTICRMTLMAFGVIPLHQSNAIWNDLGDYSDWHAYLKGHDKMPILSLSSRIIVVDWDRGKHRTPSPYIHAFCHQLPCCLSMKVIKIFCML